jgi:hypothetical protein
MSRFFHPVERDTAAGTTKPLGQLLLACRTLSYPSLTAYRPWTRPVGLHHLISDAAVPDSRRGRAKRYAIYMIPNQGFWNSRRPAVLFAMTGRELKQLRQDLADALGVPLTVADMAKLCGLPADIGANTVRKWEVTGPSKPVAEQLKVFAMASDRYPILENFNVFDRFDVAEAERPARRQAFREQMRDEVRRRLVQSCT